MNRHLFLIGFMGAGKTTVGQALAQALGLHFVDLDSLIVETAGKNITSIFSEDGEPVFRDFETRCLMKLIDTAQSVVATGGGVIGRHENRTLMQTYGTTVYLFAEWATLQQRLDGTVDRPLAGSDNDWTATRNLYLKRAPLYQQADIVVKTDQKTVHEIVDEIKNHA